MGYETAPATKMLATHCCVCGHALLDSVSVEAGMGPECREKYGYNIAVNPEARDAANKIVHAIACGNPQGGIVIAIGSLRIYGFERLADTLVDRLAKVKIEQLGNDRMAVYTPYDAGFVQALRETTPWRKFVKDEDGARWIVPSTKPVKDGIWKALKRSFRGQLALGPQGLFEIEPGAVAVAS